MMGVGEKKLQRLRFQKDIEGSQQSFRRKPIKDAMFR